LKNLESIKTDYLRRAVRKYSFKTQGEQSMPVWKK